MQLVGKGFAVEELLFATDAADKLDAQGVAVETAFEVEQMYFDGAMGVVVDGGAATDVEHTFIYMSLCPHTHGIYSIGWDKFQGIVHLYVGRGIAQCATNLLAGNDVSVEKIVVSQATCGFVHFAGL